MSITEKVAYLRGLADGLGIDTEKSKEGKVIAVIIDVLEEMGMSLTDLEDEIVTIGEEIDAISDDLSDVEEQVADSECGCGCGHDHDHGDEDFFEVECPTCGEDLLIDEDILAEGVIECDNCDSKFALEINGHEAEEELDSED